MAEDMPGLADHASRWGPAAALRKTVTVLQYAYPVFMLIFFLVAFTVRSIAATNSNINIAKPTTTGPGGKPLPATDPTRNFVKKTVQDDVTQTQKRVFEWVSLAAALTFIGNSVLVIAHSLAKQSEHWWAGKSVVVRTRQRDMQGTLPANTTSDLPRRLLLHLLPVPHLAARLQALADRRPPRDMECRRRPRGRPRRAFPRNLHARAQRAHCRTSQHEAAIPHDRLGGC
jgi:hypothetical protein